MGSRYDVPANKYSHTPRGVFEKFVDKVTRRHHEARKDHRALLARVQNLELLWDQLFPIEEREEEHDQPPDDMEELNPAERRARRRAHRDTS